jgi:hypothetical protein
MGKMGQYCKAYQLDAMRQFARWHENAQAFRKREDAAAESADGDPPDNDHIVYLQENHVVTDGIFIDENVIFDEVTEAWIEFCQKTLNFELPDGAIATAEQAESLTTNA